MRPGGLGHRYGIDQHSRSAWAKKNLETTQEKKEEEEKTEKVATQTTAPSRRGRTSTWSRKPWWKLDRIPTSMSPTTITKPTSTKTEKPPKPDQAAADSTEPKE